METIDSSNNFPAKPTPLETQREISILTIMDRITEHPDFDPTKLESLFKMHMEMEKRNAEIAFDRAMANAQQEIQMVVVNRRNNHTNSLFADISALHKAAKPIWTKWGFSVVSYTKPSDLEGHVKIACRVANAGHNIEFEDDWPLDNKGLAGSRNKTDIQGKGSTLTYGRRYIELGVFDVAISRLDIDGNTPQLGEDQQSESVKEKLAALKKVKEDEEKKEKGEVVSIQTAEETKETTEVINSQDKISTIKAKLEALKNKPTEEMPI